MIEETTLAALRLNVGFDTESDVPQLPKGKHCEDCQNYAKCIKLFGCSQLSDVCDWFPSRFKNAKVSNVKLSTGQRREEKL